MTEKMLDKTNEVETTINDSVNSIQNNKEMLRSELKDSINRHDLAIQNAGLSSGGVDGAYVVERLLGTDLLFSCALVTEGSFAKPQKEISSSSSSPANYEVFVYPEKHNPENAILARAIMLQMEIKMASSSHMM